MLYDVLKKIEAPNYEIMTAVTNRVDQLIKPQGSMGQLEEIVIKLSGITHNMYPKINKKAMIVMCADHGVCDEEVASAPQVVTLVQAKNIPRGLTGVGALAKHSNTKIYAVDLGINSDFEDSYVINKKIMYGTNNIAVGPAMSSFQAIQALEVGISMAIQAVNDGADILGTGEMGIGNTTPTTAILSVISNMSPDDITGIGANFPIEKLSHKATVIKRAISNNHFDATNPIDLLSKLGGLDIAGMAGVMIGGAYMKVPVVIDGFISTVSALLACMLEPKIKNYLFASHASEEKGAKLATQLLGLKPYLDMNMRLGEGSGAILAFNLIEAACYMNKEMITFEEGGIGIV